MSRVFHYFSGEVVQQGDRIRSAGRSGYVAEVFQPGSDSAKTFDCPEGGVLTFEDWDGKQSPMVWRPPDGEFWEDLEFIGRKDDAVREPNKPAAPNAGWRSSAVATLWRDRQFRFAGGVFWSGVCEFRRWANE